MAIPVFTQEMFDTLPRDEFGRKSCPTGDYTGIKHFGERCSFGEQCSFGGWCYFNKECSFNGWCSFGECCMFEEDCSFKELCSFSHQCKFGDRCSFDKCCSFGKHCYFDDCCNFVGGCSFDVCCRFNKSCNFGKHCAFGEFCDFAAGCSHEKLTNSRYVAIDRIGSEKRKTYFFKADEGYFVRAGCWFSDFEKFKQRVKEVHCNTRYEKEYLQAMELAKLILDGDDN